MCNCNPTSSTSSSSVISVGGNCGTCINGVSSYTYIAFADTVTNQCTPGYNVVNFQLTAQPTTQWLGIITTNTPLTPPTAADFDCYWVQIAGPGAGGGGGTLAVEEFGTLKVPSASVLNFLATDLAGVVVTNAGGNQADVEIATSAFRKITRAAALVDIGANALKAGTTYWIYDVGDGQGHTNPATAYAGIILRAASPNLFDSTGLFISRNVNRSTVPTLWEYGTQYNTGQLVENFNEVYEATVNGTSATSNPASNSGEWTFIGKADPTRYTTEVHRCVYDVATDMILSRSDARGNVITTYNSAVPSNNSIILKCFRWGYNTFINNKINVNLTGIAATYTQRRPDQGNFRWNAISGTMSNNVIDLVASTNYYGTSTIAGIATAPTITNVLITNNTIRNSGIAFSTNMRMVSNEFVDTTISGNVYLTTSSHITGNKGSFTITNNTNNTGNANNAIGAPTNDTLVQYCTGDNFVPGALPGNNIISGNIGSLIWNCKFKQAEIVNNINMLIYGSSLENSSITDNVADGRNDANRFISQVNMRSQSFISRNYFKGFSSLGIGGYAQKIIYGTLSNRYTYIANNYFDTSINKNISLDSVAYTLKPALIAGFNLDNVHIDGDYTGAGAAPPATYQSGIYSIAGGGILSFIISPLNDAYSPTASNSANTAYVFLDLENTSIFNVGTGVLTVPNSCLHAGTFILYNVPLAGATISSIVINTAWTGSSLINSPTSVKGSYLGPWKFINGTGIVASPAGVTFTFTAVAGITNNQIARTPSLSSVVLTRTTEFLEITKQGTYYTVNNVQTVA